MSLSLLKFHRGTTGMNLLHKSKITQKKIKLIKRERDYNNNKKQLAKGKTTPPPYCYAFRISVLLIC